MVTMAVTPKVQFVSCGQCYACLQNKRVEWTFKLEQELKVSKTAWFITLTYNHDNLVFGENQIPTLYVADLQKFIKRCRQYQKRNTNSEQTIRYFACGEYGEKNDRPHYHLIMFNLHPKTLNNLQKLWSIYNKSNKTYDPIGQIKVGTVTTASIHYTTKYIINRFGEYDNKLKPFVIMSRKPPRS